MKNNEIIQLLIKEDKTNSCFEYPDIFDREKEVANAKRIFSIFLLNFNFEFILKTGVDIQDASFHSDVTIINASNIKKADKSYIRFSNFGNFVSIFDQDNILSLETTEGIISILQNNSYVYVPDKILSSPYNGKFKKSFGKYSTWSRRFFDYG